MRTEDDLLVTLGCELAAAEAGNDEIALSAVRLILLPFMQLTLHSKYRKQSILVDM